MHLNRNNILLFIALLIFSNCTKFLNEKPDQQLAVPTSVKDLQALLDNYEKLNLSSDASSPEMSADNYYLTTTDWNNLSEENRRMYTWVKDFLLPQWPNNWSTLYDQVYIANTVLNALPEIPKNTEAEWNHVKGQAHFWRAKAFQQLAFGWCLAYDSVTANTDLGLPLRLNPDFNLPSVRNSVEATYKQIIDDLKEAAKNLSNNPVSVLRPSKPAAFGLLARTYLAMRKYKEAGLYADSCLQLKNTLMDYNAFNAAATYPMPAFNTGNTEIIFESRSLNPAPLSNSISKTDSLLYASYNNNDTRKTLFFRNNNNGTYGFKGSYETNSAQFTGLATDEMYLTRAECFIRNGNLNAGLNDLNSLLVKRFKTGTFTPLTATTVGEALDKVLWERRKQLLYRNWRWIDIKRLNKEGAGIVLKRIINNQEYTLPPNDNRYALPLPELIINLTGMQQNPR